ncbi:ABC transporter ATP-binding protein YtrB [Caprobacter fermentans]|uniref:ABC transporter ATP-binding protein n=1 Tax=Caproicibacter fermentans TaxID=2576756 RepID=A0A6N8HV87_9FIRM|nr:ABC transporter ATP-binding protein [Caproicibacter fermentans]MVB09589.1 ABC transporter ATP-binding protein YtrB [Caproicibacter fermentans]OCN01826.1 ABC transporter [Clostridium sp. W14A]QNK40064.1 ABC transporter ATP-binding protein [Caproicibacter fermentans]
MIEVQNLTKKFGAKAALDNVNFTIGGGSVFGLVGSNGAGKSTFLRTCAGIYFPDGGNVLVDGKAPFENAEVKSKICFIPDYPYFLPQATLSDMAKFYSGIYPKWDAARFEDLCKLFPVGKKERITNFSKGMQRQAALICAFAARPEYLLMDEIFDGLDPVMRQLLKKLICEEVSEHNLTVIIASHNLRELEDLCDHVGLFHKGGILFEKDIDALRLGVCKVQAAFRPMPERSAFEPMEILEWETRGSLLNLVVRGGRDEVLEKLNSLNPIFAEALPLTLEEVFISEMEVAGYDINNILS